MSAEALGAVGDHLELVAQLLRGQAAVRGEGDGAELGELLAALTRSSAALGAQRLRAPSRAPPAPSAPPAAAEQGLRAGAAAAANRPPPQLIGADYPAVAEDDDPRSQSRDSVASSASAISSFFGNGYSSRSNRKVSFSHPILQTVERFVRSIWMEGITALLIAANTTFMIIEGQYLGAGIGSEIGVYSYYGSDRFSEEGVVLTSDMFGTIEVVFCVLFTIELVVRLTFLRLDFLRDPWGWLDTAIVLTTDATTFFPDLLGQAMPVMTLRVTRLARLLRIMRLARSITAFDSLYLLTTALRGSISTLVWVIAFLFITQTLFALLLTSIVRDFYLAPSGDGDDFFQNALEKEQIYLYFGTYWRSMVSLFELMLANWPPICRMMMETMHEFWSVFALGYKLFMGVAVIGVIMGVFTQETFRAADTDDQIMMRRKAFQARTQRLKMKKLFEGMISYNENVDVTMFDRFLKTPDIRFWMQAQDYDVNDASLLFYLIDKDGDGTLTVDELIDGMAALKGAARNLDVKVLMRQSRFGALQGQLKRSNSRMSARDSLRVVQSSFD